MSLITLPPARTQKKALRNLEIFKLVEIQKLSHDEIATRFRIHRSRVTQIVKQVRAALADANPDDPEVESHFARQRLARKMERLQLEYALDAAAQAMRRDPAVLVTNRAGSRDKNGEKEGWSETIRRDKPANVQVIKTYLRVARDLGELNERERSENPIQFETLTQYKFISKIADLLSNWCHAAPDRHDHPSDAFMEMVKQFTANLHTWCHRFRYGKTEVTAWPIPEETPASIDDCSSTETGEPETNHQEPQTNPKLTSELLTQNDANHETVTT